MNPEDNVMCKPCPQGTWSEHGGLTSVLDCKHCEARYVCPIEGITNFATIEQPCNSTDPNEICYGNSQGWDCPQGYGCGISTTAFTQKDAPCEAGFWCKVRTLPAETRNLLCPPGFYCREGTGESGGTGRMSFPCPNNYFCPEGTGAVDRRVGNRMLVEFNNVQSRIAMITQPHQIFSSMCRRCPETVEPGRFDLTQCEPCGVPFQNTQGEPARYVLIQPPADQQSWGLIAVGALNISGEATKCAPDISSPYPRSWQPSDGLCYTANPQWSGTLSCPEGTRSNIGASDPDDCKQMESIIAVVNIYKCYPPRTPENCRPTNEFPADFDPLFDCKEEDVLCGLREEIEDNKRDPNYRKSFVWGARARPQDPLSPAVDFLAYNPEQDAELAFRRPFNKVHLRPMDIAVLLFNFTGVNPTTRLNAGRTGHFDIHIHSDKLVGDRQLESGHTLPRFFQRSVNSRLYIPFELKILALEELTFSVQIDLRHGGHTDFINTLNETLDIKRYGPNRTLWGKRNFFSAVISKEFLLDGNYELPYNMRPATAGQPGELALTIDAINTANMVNAPQSTKQDGRDSLDANVVSGTAFWSSEAVETVALPWLPFFSHCETYDSHVIIWDLFEDPGGLHKDACQRYTKDETRIVPDMAVDFSTLEFRMSPVADTCEITVRCHYEENLEPDSFSSTLWFEIEEAEAPIMYLTRDAVDYETFNKRDAFGEQQGQDSLIQVMFSAEGRSARIPRRVVFDIGYYQVSQEVKQIVRASMALSEFDDDNADDSYYLKLKFEPLGWEKLMNAFQLPYAVYSILYCVIGMGAVCFTLVFWFILRVTTRKARAPPFRWGECYEFLLWWPIQGVVVATVPITILCAIIKLSQMPAIDVTANLPCTYESLTLGIMDETEKARCRSGRTGTCFLIAGVLMLFSGSQKIVPRLREVEEQFLLQQPSQMLNREGVPLATEQRQQIKAVPVRWKRAHLIFVSMMLVFPLMMMWEFTYAALFEEQAIMFIVGFNVIMIPIEGALSHAVREELLQVPMDTACRVVLFIGTLGAEDFTDFCEGYFIELIIMVIDRLVLLFVFKWIIKSANFISHWARTRAWFWSIVLMVTGNKSLSKLTMDEPLPDRDADPSALQMEEEVEGTPIEEAMEEIIGCGTTCMSTVLSPFLIGAIIIFAEESQIPSMYNIRRSDLWCYLLFGLVIAPFQVLMDILMNHATEVAHGVRIYDYMLYAKWRWRNRLTRWLFDDPRMDQSIAEPLQSANHLAFSPQFYFIEAYFSWGLLMLLLAVTMLVRSNANPFDDPALGFFLIQQIICNRFLDGVIGIMISNILWKPKSNSLFKVFSRSVSLALRRKDAHFAQESYRKWWMERHRPWLISRLGEIFTPRAQVRYKSKLAELYQQALSLQPQLTYKVPGKAFPDPVGHEELPENLRLELEEDSSDEDNREDAFTPLALTSATGQVPALPPAPSSPALPALPPGSAGLGPQRLPLPPLRPLSPFEQRQQQQQQELLQEAPRPQWPLATAEGETHMAGGYGPLAGHVGRAWLLTARRRLRMLDFAEQMRKVRVISEACSSCGVREDDPFVLERVGTWVNGAQLRMQVTLDLRQLVIAFEQHHGVPPLPYDAVQWEAWINRHDPFTTMCCRCVQEKGLEPSDLPQTLEEVVPQSRPTTRGSARSDISIEDEPKKQRFPGLVNLDTVSSSSREMMMYWAMVARRRVKHRRQTGEGTVAQEPFSPSSSSSGSRTP